MVGDRLTRLSPIPREVKQEHDPDPKGRVSAKWAPVFRKDHAPKKGCREMNELDFSGKQVLVVGGSSGIGNGIAQAFRAKGARVSVCGTRAAASDYSAAEGSH